MVGEVSDNLARDSVGRGKPFRPSSTTRDSSLWSSSVRSRHGVVSNRRRAVVANLAICRAPRRAASFRAARARGKSLTVTLVTTGLRSQLSFFLKN